jgi:ABC-2 type transport system permease protein
MWRDAWLIFHREFVRSTRNPSWILISVAQPVLYLIFFGPLIVRLVAHTPGFPPGDDWQIFTPALLVMLGLFGSAFAGFSVLAELRTGVIERLQVTPVSRLALLLGKVANNALQTLAQGIVLVVIAVVTFGLRAPVWGIVIALIMVMLLAITLASCSYALALRIKSEEAFPALLNAILLPVLLLSGILIPITTGLAPRWLYVISQINPFRHVVDAERAGFRGDLTAAGLLTGSIVLLVITALAVAWGAATFQRENA